jgi:type II secretion system-associated lipoprotein
MSRGIFSINGLIFIAAILMISSCSTFMLDEEVAGLKKYEGRIYILKKEHTQGDQTLKKDQKIRIVIKPGKESIRVYGYDASAAILKSSRVLILYLFNDDFTNKRFDSKTFESKFYSVVKPD